MSSILLLNNLNTTVDQAFRDHTTPEILRDWFAPEGMSTPLAEIDLKIGGSCKFTMRDSSGKDHTASGEITEFIPNQKFCFTWGWDGPTFYETEVCIEFDQSPNGCDITFTHTGFKSDEEAKEHKKGWIGCYNKLKKLRKNRR